MVNSINSGLLTDTLNIVQLARETALAQGKNAQAQRLTPVVQDLQSIVTTSRGPQAPAVPTGALAQDDFRTLLAAAQAPTTPVQASQSMNSVDRNRMVVAMSGGSMSEVDIARQLGMTRDEVHLILSVNQKGRNGLEGA